MTIKRLRKLTGTDSKLEIWDWERFSRRVILVGLIIILILLMELIK